jgi:hypothetical protein
VRGDGKAHVHLRARKDPSKVIGKNAYEKELWVRGAVTHATVAFTGIGSVWNWNPTPDRMKVPSA